VGGFFFAIEWGYVIAFAFFIAMMFVRPQGLFEDEQAMIGNYPLHLMILVLLWGYIYTSWSLMGRMGMVSFGHGAFMGIGAYTVVMLWNHYGVSPWIGAPAALAVAAVVAIVIAYPCFRFRIVGHYFALVTLALSEVTRLVFTAMREQTGGSLGATPNGALTEGASVALGALQFSSKWVWLAIVAVFWLAGCGCGALSTAAWDASRSRRSARKRRPRPRSASTSRAPSCASRSFQR
jgi:ABC-type branched-subunit amino acid transport system permease subunit